MCVQDLIDRLKELSEDQRNMPICCEDGLDPSDPSVIVNTAIKEAHSSMHIKGQYVYLIT